MYVLIKWMLDQFLYQRAVTYRFPEGIELMSQNSNQTKKDMYIFFHFVLNPI